MKTQLVAALAALLLGHAVPTLLPSAWCARAHAAADPDAFDPYHPGSYLNGKTFHVPAGASFAWQAWENNDQQVGTVTVNDQPEFTTLKVERIELARPSEEADSLVLNQYTLTVHPDVPADTILLVKTSGGAATANDHGWAFEFVLHIVPADRYISFLAKTGCT